MVHALLPAVTPRVPCRPQSASSSEVFPVVALVFYHSRQEWRVPLSVAAMTDAPEVLAPYVRAFAYALHDLGKVAPERLNRDPEARSALVALAVATTADMGEEDLDLIGAALVADGIMERVVLRYLAAMQDLTLMAMESSLRRTQPERWEMLTGTMAETWMEEGRTEGRTEGKAELLLRQMERRFGEVPGTVRARITGASTEELDTWGAALLDAPTIEDVMTSGSRH